LVPDGPPLLIRADEVDRMNVTTSVVVKGFGVRRETGKE
jgi:hypothetical protein